MEMVNWDGARHGQHFQTRAWEVLDGEGLATLNGLQDQPLKR